MSHFPCWEWVIQPRGRWRCLHRGCCSLLGLLPVSDCRMAEDTQHSGAAPHTQSPQAKALEWWQWPDNLKSQLCVISQTFCDSFQTFHFIQAAIVQWQQSAALTADTPVHIPWQRWAKAGVTFQIPVTLQVGIRIFRQTTQVILASGRAKLAW